MNHYPFAHEAALNCKCIHACTVACEIPCHAIYYAMQYSKQYTMPCNGTKLTCHVCPRRLCTRRRVPDFHARTLAPGSVTCKTSLSPRMSIVKPFRFFRPILSVSTLIKHWVALKPHRRVFRSASGRGTGSAEPFGSRQDTCKFHAAIDSSQLCLWSTR